MKKHLLLLLSMLILSCKPFDEIYKEDNRNPQIENEINGTQDWFRIIIVVENSMEGSDFYVDSNDPDKVVFFNGTIKKDKTIEVAEVIKADNYTDTYMRINSNEYKILADTFKKYRYLIVKKKKKSNKIQLVYTNQLPGYW